MPQLDAPTAGRLAHALALADQLAAGFATAEARRGVYRGAAATRRMLAETDTDLALADAYDRRADELGP